MILLVHLERVRSRSPFVHRAASLIAALLSLPVLDLAAQADVYFNLGHRVRLKMDSASTSAERGHIAAGPTSSKRTSRFWVVGGAHVIAAILADHWEQAKWGQSNGRFHMQDKWSGAGDGLLQNDEISHLMAGYYLTKGFSYIWSWTGMSPGRSRTWAVVEAGILVTLVEFPYDAFNPKQGLSLQDLGFGYTGVGLGLLALRHPGRWDFKFSRKDVFRNSVFSESPRESDNYVWWATYRPSLGWGQRQPLSVGLGHSVRRGADGITPVRELYLGLGTTIPDLVRSLAPSAARHLGLLEAYYVSVHVRATLQ